MQPRQSMRFRVRSRDLPGFQAITLDLSQSGVQLETEGTLAPGAELDLNIEFDREDLGDFVCPAKVVWCRPEHRSRSFRAGLVFLPADDGLRTTLARTATVLQAHSDSDIEALLEQAKLIDPERAETFARVRAQAKPGTPAPTSPSAAKRVLPLLGIYIPLRIMVEGYQWDRRTGLLTVAFSDATQEHSLFFPGCRLLTDYGCADRPTVAGLYSTPHSEIIKKQPSPAPPLGWKHYRFMLASRQPILEIVSAPCQSTPTPLSV